ncbi:MAG: alpha/beta fold hydrolase [Spirochaetales bacterium]|nr:alpha/beta fold hydrolase [Spirochaetales bacterium]MCF7938120.1 alpha/beta fold hydrolase [Spirochaetales bacterium]
MEAQSVDLNTIHVGEEGKDLCIVHGLFGAGSNWKRIAGYFTPDYRVTLPDLRNHGDSPHTEEMDYRSMSGDLLACLDSRDADQIAMVGHSMGGKVAADFALRYPDRVRALVVVDIALKQYPPMHEHILDAMSRLPVGSLEKRTDGDTYLAETIDSKPVRAFLLQNLVRADEGFRWRLNLETLRRQYDIISSFPLDDHAAHQRRNEVPALFLSAEKSPYLKESDRPGVLELFPNARFETIEGAGHWVHAEKTEEFVEMVRSFLAEC